MIKAHVWMTMFVKDVLISNSIARILEHNFNSRPNPEKVNAAHA
jgi:hypothetical protein